MTIKEIVVSCFTTHRGKTIGFLGGLVFGILFLMLGFWRGLFLSLAIGIGCWIGSFYDRKESFLTFLSKMISDGIHNRKQ